MCIYDDDRGDEEYDATKEPDGSEGYVYPDTPMADSEPYDPADAPF